AASRARRHYRRGAPEAGPRLDGRRARAVCRRPPRHAALCPEPRRAQRVRLPRDPRLLARAARHLAGSWHRRLTAEKGANRPMAGARYQPGKTGRDGGVPFLYFTRPEKRNAMSPQLCAEMVAALTELETDPATQVLVLTGAGDAFTAGMDLR